MNPGSGSTMPMLVSAGSVRMAATSPWASARLDRGEVVPRGRAGREVERHRGSDVAGRGTAPCRPARGWRRSRRPSRGSSSRTRGSSAAGREPGQAHRPAVGVGRRQREAPQRHPEPGGQLGPDPLRVRGGKHRRDAAEVAHTGAPPPRRSGGGVPGHRPGVAEREVDVGVAVDVGDPVAAGVVEVEREAACPLVHPGHRHAAEEVAALREQFAAAGVGLRRSAACSAAMRSVRRERSIGGMRAR
jgi:hypothetical protein